MKYCSKCGTKLHSDSKFCDNCGHKLTKEKDPKTETNSKTSINEGQYNQKLIEFLKTSSKLSGFFISCAIVIPLLIIFRDFVVSNISREATGHLFFVLAIAGGIIINNLYDFSIKRR